MKKKILEILGDNIAEFKKALNLQKPILGIHFADNVFGDAKHYRDTACTALNRAFKHGETLVFGTEKYPQLCSGANYFLKLSEISDSEALKVYVEDEHIFLNGNIYQKFLSFLPKFPPFLEGKFIIIKPFERQDDPNIIIFLVNPAQANRIIGLLSYSNYRELKFFPCQPTCVSMFIPLVTNCPHVNFIDYYDRYYQGCINGKYLWREEEMIISLSFDHFKAILNNINKSPFGTYKRVNVAPQNIDSI